MSDNGHIVFYSVCSAILLQNSSRFSKSIVSRSISGLMPGKRDVLQAYRTKPNQDALPNVPQSTKHRFASGRKHIQRISISSVPWLLNSLIDVSGSKHSNASYNLWHVVGDVYATVPQENQSQKNISQQSKPDTPCNSKLLKDYLTSILLMNQACVSRPISRMHGKNKGRPFASRADPASAGICSAF